MSTIRNFVILNFALINNCIFSLALFNNAPNIIIGTHYSRSDFAAKMITETIAKTETNKNNEQPNKCHSYINFINENKKPIALVTISLLFLCPLYKICKLNWYIQNKDSWGYWKADISTEKLLSMDPRELSKEMISELQKKYNQMPTTSFSSFNQFYCNLDRELRYLNSAKNLISCINFFHLENLYQINKHLLNVVNEKLLRVGHLKKVFDKCSLGS